MPPPTTVDPARRAAAARSLLWRGWRGRPGDPAWVRAGLLALLAATGVLYLWGLSASEWANSYYAAAAQAAAHSWKAWLFGASDWANAITVDKTPASLWVMGASVRLFGLSSWSVLAPQALQGVAAVGVLYAAVRRVAGPVGGLLAGAALAVTPVAVLMFRFNNPDALLTLLLVVAAYALVRALEGGSTRWLVLAGAAIGFGFLTKMLQAFVIVPALAGVWLYAAPTPLGRRIGQLAAAGVALVVSAGWYVAMVALWPADARPYIGGSQTNSIIELTLGYNGFQRLTGGEVGRIGGGPPGFDGGAGWLRLLEGQVGGQIAWLVPAALVLLAAGLWLRRGQPRTDGPRASLLLWGGWLAVTAAVFSAMQGIFHGYYTVALAPAVAALAAIGAAECWTRRHDERVARLALATAVGLTAVWSAVLVGREPDWLPWLAPVVIGAGAVAAGVLARGPRARLPVAGAATAAVLGALLAPAAVSVSTAATPQFGAIPRVSPSLAGQSALWDGFTAWIGDDAPAGDAPGGDRSAADRVTGDGPRGGPAGAAPAGGLPGAGAADGPAGGGRSGDGFTTRPDRALRSAGQRRSLLPATGRDASANASTTWMPPGGGPLGALTGGLDGLGGLLAARTPPAELVEVVEADAEAYRWAAATVGSNQAAGVQLAAGVPVMAIGGFNGTDPSPTLAQFKGYVAAGEIHYFLGDAAPGPGPAGFGPARGGSNAASQIRDWVQRTFPSQTIAQVTVYDLDP